MEEETIFGRKKPNEEKPSMDKVEHLETEDFEKMLADVKSDKKEKWQKILK